MKVEGSAHAFFLRMSTAYRASKTLLTANRMGLFDVLEEWTDPEQVAHRIACDPRATRILLDALVSLEVVQYEGGRFRNGRLASEHLVSSKPSFVGHNLIFQDMIWDCWSHLEDVVRGGRPYQRLPDLLAAEDASFTREYIRAMQPIAAAPSVEVARVLSDRPMQSMLDVGGGPGTYTCALLAANPDMTATLLDLPTTLVVTRELTASDPAAGRISYRAGSYLTDDFGADFDLVLMSHVTHDESATSVVEMARRAFAALRPGGRLAVHDWIVGEAPGPETLPQALFSLNVMVYTDGQVYSEREYRAMLGAAGFAGVELHSILADALPNPTHLIIGHKR